MTTPMIDGIPERLLHRNQIFIGGTWVFPSATGNAVMSLTNPYTEQAMGSVVTASTSDIDAAVAAARDAFDNTSWSRMPPSARAPYLSRVAGRYREIAPLMARLITRQNGSPASFTAQTGHPQRILRSMAAYGSDPRLFQREGSGYTVRREPVGVVALILPWNMPQKTLLMKLAPALLAGCTVIVKPAPETPLDALYLAELFDNEELPPGVLNVVPVTRETATLEHLVTHPGIDKIAFTGSTATGIRIASLAAPAMRRVTLELGGKSPAVICESADLDLTVKSLRDMSLANSGQICSNLTRILVPYRMEHAVVERLQAMMEGLVIGDPADPATELGPLVSRWQLDRVQAAVHTALNQGADLVTGGGRLERDGFFMAPTLFRGVRPDSDLAQQEVFGPVLSVMTYRDEQDAIALANNSRYGLAAGVYSADDREARRIAARLHAGTVYLNGADTPIDAPLGGFKESGVGRELGPEGLAAYQEIKVVSG